ncbi:biotin--[acetyl-CoA-carboxylase] ligase [candidate division WOR-3 bacterium]|uniref:biotin--[biotin carboxyl-carrier protein] ligase n=1 Tax=candidate division WOR-3 bacterium TaxID=2052148 RepID=A0A660SMJ8_UNCW3|nr:MAG: biotin--[acetyl-CoA-carboxylase] ligase [candidate division WOR-3 bacterium]
MIIFFDKLPSTNDYGLKYGQDFQDWTVVWAKVQTKGRGRLGRTWYSPEGGLWFTIILKPGRALPLLTLSFAVGVVEVLKRKGLDVYLKWPNDILIKRRKVGGILTEYDAQTGILVAGFGINCNLDIDDFPIGIRDQVTTIRRELGHDMMLYGLLEEIIKELKPIYEDVVAGKALRWLNAWRERSRSIGCSVVVTLPDRTIKGYAIDVDEQGRLLVRTDFGVEKIIAGEVKFIE